MLVNKNVSDSSNRIKHFKENGANSTTSLVSSRSIVETVCTLLVHGGKQYR